MGKRPVALFLFLALFHAAGLAADEPAEARPPDNARSRIGLLDIGVGLGAARNFSPDTDTVRWNQASLIATFNHDPVFPYRPAATIHWLTELSFGLTDAPLNEAMASLGMHAMWAPWSNGFVRPFLSGGIGVVYTEWQVQGQSLHFNFNPQLGIGADFPGRGLVTVRWHHISNGGLSQPNVGVNSILVMVGVYF